ncbi:MAG: acyl-CoA dehydratase activase-related protein [bacterium]|nr:acyl-CoA dehydratase activase-related protein [bacterium]
MKHKIGIPRALLYHKYHFFWEEFLRSLGQEVVVSPETNREIIGRGVNLAVDESCLSVKIYLGHVDYLKDKVDFVFIPRVVSLYKKENLCVKFMALNDIVRNTFDGIKILEYTTHVPTFRYDFIGLFGVGWQLTHNPFLVLRAIARAKKTQRQQLKRLLLEQEMRLKGSDKNLKILIVAHPYTTYDSFLGIPITSFLEKQGVELVFADLADEKETRELSKNISTDLYWTYNKELVGALEKYRKEVAGVIFIMTFPCGPDSLVIDLCQNKVNDLPIVVITLDELQGEAGLKTRLESFVDILKIRNERGVH